MIDWSLAKKGAILNLENGGKITLPVDCIIDDSRVKVFYQNNDFLIYDLNGRYVNVLSPFDIISITPAPEPKKIVGYVNVYGEIDNDATEGVYFGSLVENLEELNIFIPLDTLEITWTEGGTPTIKSVREK
jgi:hypothetical protein